MKIYFVRHGLTDANVEKRAMGKRVDEQLNEAGIEQARELAERIDRDFDILFSSPLKRAYQTAEFLSDALRLPVLTHEGLAERDNGVLAGKLWTEITEMTKGGLTMEKLHREMETDFTPFGGEAKESVRERVNQFLADIKTTYPDKKILAVTHAGIIRVLYAQYGKGYPERMENVSVHEFEI